MSYLVGKMGFRLLFWLSLEICGWIGASSVRLVRIPSDTTGNTELTQFAVKVERTFAIQTVNVLPVSIAVIPGSVQAQSLIQPGTGCVGNLMVLWQLDPADERIGSLIEVRIIISGYDPQTGKASSKAPHLVQLVSGDELTLETSQVKNLHICQFAPSFTMSVSSQATDQPFMEILEVDHVQQWKKPWHSTVQLVSVGCDDRDTNQPVSLGFVTDYQTDLRNLNLAASYSETTKW